MLSFTAGVAAAAGSPEPPKEETRTCRCRGSPLSYTGDGADAAAKLLLRDRGGREAVVGKDPGTPAPPVRFATAARHLAGLISKPSERKEEREGSRGVKWEGLSNAVEGVRKPRWEQELMAAPAHLFPAGESVWPFSPMTAATHMFRGSMPGGLHFMNFPPATPMALQFSGQQLGLSSMGAAAAVVSGNREAHLSGVLSSAALNSYRPAGSGHDDQPSPHHHHLQRHHRDS
ncbi:hypothetical protein KSP39_PZI015138 [Platanthera zijinensis]|uniref:Uncharacterized protein n=1 Tax=Platanthera zijinensis TaxID=2320716 RepID=A0AAP0BBH5_9ASPA